MNLNTKIQEFYDASTPLWLDMWGEHMHHGYYGPNGSMEKDRIAAQIDMIETILSWAKIGNPKNILDAGCGVGGSARYLRNKYGANVMGWTLSPIQAAKAQILTDKAGMSNAISIEVRDMMTLNHLDGHFDLIWSMESMEHLSDKARLFDLFYNGLTPGGKLIVATWCLREPSENLSKKEHRLLSKIYKHYHLPPMVPINQLSEMAKNSGFQNISSDDWSKSVAPFWDEVIRSALSWKGIKGLLSSGMSTIKGAWAMQYMQRGFKENIIKFGVLTAIKPTNET